MRFILTPRSTRSHRLVIVLVLMIIGPVSAEEALAPAAEDIAGTQELSVQELGETLGSLQQNYQVLRQAFQRVALHNEAYCEEAERLAAACPLTLPISAGFLQAGICGKGGFGPHPVRATVQGQGRWKLLMNGVYESSGFSGENQQISFVKKGASPAVSVSEHVEFFVPFKNITTIELVPQGGSTTNQSPVLTLTAGERVIMEAVSFDAVTREDGSSVWRADLASLQQAAREPACHPVFEDIQARVSERVRERLKNLAD